MIRPRLINRAFEAVLQILNKIPNINRGGCGIATLAMYRWLEAYYPEYLKEIKIVYLYHGFGVSEFEENNQKINSGKKNIVTPQHICILWNDYHIDAKGRIDLNRDDCEYEYQHTIPNVKYLLQTINRPNGSRNWWNYWNDTFSRSKNVEQIATTLKIDLSDVKV